MAEPTIEQVLRAYSDRLMAIPGVVATALGMCDGAPCIKVYARHKTPALQAQLPASLEGFPVCLEEAGTLRARPDDAAGP